MLDETRAKGRVHLLLTDQYGRVKEDRTINNKVVIGGRAYIIDHMHEWTYTTTTVSGSTLTLANHGFHNGDEIVFTNLAGNTGLTASNTIYWIVGANGSAGTFQVAATEGGAAITITGTANMSFRHRPNNVLGMALGTSATAAADADTALLAEVSPRKTGAALTVSKQTGGGLANAQDTIRFSAQWIATEATGAITEAGLYTNTATTGAGTAGGASGGVTYTGGILIARTVFPVINKGSADTLTIQWDIQITGPGT